MEPLGYLHLQMELEGIGLTQGTLMTCLHSSDDEFPLALVAQTAKGQTVAYFAETLSPEIRERLVADTRKMTFPNVEGILNVLRASGIQPQTGHYKTYVFPPSYATVEVALVQCCAKDDPAIQAFGFDGLADQVSAIAEDGGVLSACVSARQKPIVLSPGSAQPLNIERKALLRRLSRLGPKAPWWKAEYRSTATR